VVVVVVVTTVIYLTQLLFLWKSVCIVIYCKAFGTACSLQSNTHVAKDIMIYGVTINGFLIGNWIYCTLIHTTFNK
jgi:uncharacterized membrane protein